MTSWRYIGLKAVLNSLSVTGLDRLSMPYTGGRGAILMLHHVRATHPHAFGGNDELAITPEFLTGVLEVLKKQDIDIIPMDDVMPRLRDKSNTKRFVAITFDDGYRDNLDIAYPILKENDAPFTIFACTGFLDRTQPIWWQSVEEIVRDQDEILIPHGHVTTRYRCESRNEKRYAFCVAMEEFFGMSEEQQRIAFTAFCKANDHDALALTDSETMTWDELRALNEDPLATIGGHTNAHHALARLSDSKAIEEIETGVQRLGTELGMRPKHFAYPYGSAREAVAQTGNFVEDAGFETAVTTRKGMIFDEHLDSVFGLPRLSLNGYYQEPKFFETLFSGLPFALMHGGKRFVTF